MRTLKSLLVALIGLTALLYAGQGIANLDEMLAQIGNASSQAAAVSHSLTVSLVGFAIIILCDLVIAAAALKGGWDIFAARNGTPDEFRASKSAAVWAGGLSLLNWFLISLMIGSGLFQWGTEFGPTALAKAFALGTTSALTVLFVWGTTD